MLMKLRFVLLFRPPTYGCSYSCYICAAMNVCWDRSIVLLMMRAKDFQHVFRILHGSLCVFHFICFMHLMTTDIALDCASLGIY